MTEEIAELQMEKSEKQQTGRVAYFDVLKGFGIILMVMGHIGFGEVFQFYIHAFHMPLFFIVSGYFFDLERNPDTAKYILKKVRTILVPYVSFALLFFILTSLLTEGGGWKWGLWLKKFWSSNHNCFYKAGGLWFLMALFVVEVVFYLMAKYMREGLGILVLEIGLIGGMLERELPLTLDSAMIGIGLYYIGFLIKKYERREKPLGITNMGFPGLLVLSVTSGILIFQNQYVNLRVCKYGNIGLFWINAVLTTLLYWNLFKKMEGTEVPWIKWIQKMLQTIGQDSIIYLCLNQMLILIVVGFLKQVPILEGDEVELSKWESFLVLAVVLLIIRGFAWIFKHTKLRVLIGK